MKQEKREYDSPRIEYSLIELETGIAASSAKLAPGKSGTPFTPEVEDWKDNGGQSKDFDVL